MDETKREELEGAYKKEKNQRVAARMLAVHMTRVLGEGAGETAADLMRTHKWVYGWLERYDAAGLDGLLVLPKSGRSTRVRRETLDRVIERGANAKRPYRRGFPLQAAGDHRIETSRGYVGRQTKTPRPLHHPSGEASRKGSGVRMSRL